jgi:magnesium transporter
VLTAFAHDPDGATEELDNVGSIAQRWIKPDVRLWIDVEEPTEPELRALGDIFHLDAEAIDDCLHGEQHPRIDEFEDHIFLVVYGMMGEREANDYEPRKLAVFCGPRYLITVHRERLRTISAVRGRCRRNAAQVLGRGVDFVLYAVIDGMVDNYTLVAEAYEDQLEALEDASLNPDVEDDLLTRVRDLRWDLLDLRRLAASQLQMLAPLTSGEYDFIGETLERRFAHVRDHLAKVVNHLENLRELLHGVQDNYHAMLADRMNQVMKTLTVMATILLPLSVITGIYGMNVPLWPAPGLQATFWGILCLMAVIVIASLFIFRRRRWL